MKFMNFIYAEAMFRETGEAGVLDSNFSADKSFSNVLNFWKAVFFGGKTTFADYADH